MLSVCTQTAIAVLHDISSGNALQSANFLHSEGEWKGLFDKLEKGGLIRCLPYEKPVTLSSYKLCRPLPDISLPDVPEAREEPIHCTMSTPEAFYICHSRITNQIGVLNEVARALPANIKIADW